MFIINKTSIINKMNQRNKKIDNLVKNESLEMLREKKINLIEEFEKHEISEELNDGGGREESSFLNGRSGNLRAFIGFYPEDDPVNDIKKILEDSIRLLTFPTVLQRTDGLEYKYMVAMPTLEEIYTQTPYPDGHTGGSWVRGIHRGIPGLQHYLFSTSKDFKNSRSNYAIQVDNVVRPGSHSGRKYIDELLNNFKRKK